jgi:hypothetical protein
MPKKNKFFVGLQSYSIFKRYLENEQGKLRSQQEFFLLSYGIFDWLSVDLKGGAGYIKQHPVASDELDYPSYLGGGYGFRLRLYERNKIRATFGFQHVSIHPKTVFVGPVKNKAVLDEWQFSIVASRDFKKITPYLGAKWSRSDYIHWTTGERNRVKSDLTKSVGLVFGFDIPIAEKFWFNLESHFFDSDALAISLNYSF